MFLKNTPVQVQLLDDSVVSQRFLVRGIAKRAIYVEIRMSRKLDLGLLHNAVIRAALIAKRHQWKRIYISKETVVHSGCQFYCNHSEANEWFDTCVALRYWDHPERDFSCWDDPINIDYSILISL